MNKQWKQALNRLASFTLALFMCLGLMPFGFLAHVGVSLREAWANPQVPVASQRIEPPALNWGQGALGSPYTFQVAWDWITGPNPVVGLPNPSTGIGQQAVNTFNNLNHQPAGFDLRWRNISTGEAFQTGITGNRIYNYEHTWPTTAITAPGVANNTPAVGNPGIPMFHPFTNMTLAPASFHAFTVVPFHYHLTRNETVVAGVVTNVNYGTNRVWPTVPTAESLFLTDISVELSQGNNGGIQVTWQNPTIAGQTVFSGYRLQVLNANTGNQVHSVDVNVNTPGVTTGANWSFEVTHQAINPGVGFNVRVIPLVGGNPILQLLPGGQRNQAVSTFPAGTLGVAQTDPISFTFSGRDFINTEPFVLPVHLRLDPHGAGHIALSWGMPTSNVRNIQIWQANVDPENRERPNPQVDILIQSASGPNLSMSSVVLPQPTTSPVWFMVYIETNLGTTAAPNWVRLPTNWIRWDSALNDFESWAPTIFQVTGTDAPSLNVTWRAFSRYLFENEALANFPINRLLDGRQFVVDNDLFFDVYISDSLANINNENLERAYRLNASQLTLPADITGTADRYPTWAYTNEFLHFVDSSNVRRPISEVYPDGNVVMYVRIQGVRTIENPVFYSDFSLGSGFIPPTDALLMTPQMVPVRIAEQGGEQLITNNAMTIEWNLSWFEVFDSATGRWHDTIGVNSAGGPLLFGAAAEAAAHRERLWMHTTETARPAVEAAVAAILALSNSTQSVIPVRFMDVSNPAITYEIHVTPTAAMGDQPPFLTYFRQINEAGNWTDIQRGTAVPNTPNRLRHQITGLAPNTNYTIFLRPVDPRVSEAQRRSWYPMFTSGTTLITRPGLDVQPTVPILEVVEWTDTAVRLRWNGSPEFTYQMRVSDQLSDFSEGGELIDSAYISEHGVINGDHIYLWVQGLFPETTFHFWIRAIAQGTSGINYSQWSNPVSATTLPAMPPQVPSGITMAQQATLTAWNQANGTTLRHGDPEHADRLLLEFNRIFADLHNPTPGPAQTGHTVANGLGADAEASWLVSEYILGRYLTQFEGLQPNTRHFVRVRSVLTITRGTGSGVLSGLTRSYSYIMQVSPHENFLDYIEITLPSLVGEPAPGQLIRIMSDWSVVNSFFTGQNDDEFDANINPDLFPLPDQDWEYTFIAPGTLRKRIRGNAIGSDGNRDNQVDQRFISRLVTNRTFNWEADLSQWGPFPLLRRELEIPFGVLQAFDERQINFTIDAGNMSVTIPYGALITPQVLAMPGLGHYTSVVLSLDQTTPPTTERYGVLYTNPHQLSVTFTQDINSVTVEEFMRPIHVTMDMPSGHNAGHANISGYEHNPNSGGWQRVASDTSGILATPTIPTVGMPRTGVDFSTRRAGSYSVFSTPAAVGFEGQNVGAMHRVNTHLHITDMPVFDENLPIHPNQFNQLVAAVALDQSTVAMNAPLPANLHQSLGRSGMLVPGNTVSREDGIAALVRLFEVRNGSAVPFYPAPGQSSFADMASVSPANSTSLRRGEALGFITGMSVNPSGVMTFGDVFHGLDVILNN